MLVCRVLPPPACTRCRSSAQSLQTNAQLPQHESAKVKYRSRYNWMAEFTSAADAPAARAMIYSMGFDHDMVQHALVQAGGNEQLAINLILNGEVHDAVTASSSAASIAGFSGPAFGFGSQSYVAPSAPPWRCRSFGLCFCLNSKIGACVSILQSIHELSPCR